MHIQINFQRIIVLLLNVLMRLHYNLKVWVRHNFRSKSRSRAHFQIQFYIRHLPNHDYLK